MRQRQGVTACVAALAALACAPAPAIAGDVVSEKAEAAKARGYWTAGRIAEAKPVAGFALPAPSVMFRGLSSQQSAADGPPVSVAPTNSSVRASRASAVTIDDTTPEGIRTHGKVIFRDGGSTFACSGTVVSSTNGSTVWTAAHCLYNQRAKRFHKRLVFIPAYNQGKRPFKRWPAQQLSVTKQWKHGGPESSDYGSALIRTKPRQRSCAGLEGEQKRNCARRNRTATRIQERVGARGIAFNRPVKQTWTAYGYPLAPAPRFDGEHLETCTSPLKRIDPNQGSPKPIGIDCDMQGGASGGGWVLNDRFVNGLVAYGYPGSDPNTVYSPYFGSQMQSFYYAVEDCPLLGCR